MQNYQLGEKIGQGGMGSVFRGRHTGLDRDVAIKFMDGAISEDQVAVERFLREAKLLAKIDHPNVVRVHDTGRDDKGQPYIVMELLDGISLSDRLKRSPMPESEAVDIACQILNALSEAHKLGIVHRDVKPANIRLCPGGKVKLLDFGIAFGADLSKLSMAGKAMGTPNYMSPEQAEGQEPVPQSDLYALGIVLYEMLTGDVPFRASTPLAVLRMHTDNPPPALPGFVSKKLREAVGWALEKRPERRFKSADAMRDALTGAIAITHAKPEAVPKRRHDPEATIPAHLSNASVRHGWRIPPLIGFVCVVGIGGLGMALGWFGGDDSHDMITVSEPIEYQTNRKSDSTIAFGRSRILGEGKDGETVITFDVVYENGKEISRTKVGEPKVTPAVNVVKLVGTSIYIYCSKRHRDVWDSKYCKECGEPFPPITEEVN